MLLRKTSDFQDVVMMESSIGKLINLKPKQAWSKIFSGGVFKGSLIAKRKASFEVYISGGEHKKQNMDIPRSDKLVDDRSSYVILIIFFSHF